MNYIILYYISNNFQLNTINDNKIIDVLQFMIPFINMNDVSSCFLEIIIIIF